LWGYENIKELLEREREEKASGEVVRVNIFGGGNKTLYLRF
jgi:hypothetical protein